MGLEQHARYCEPTDVEPIKVVDFETPKNSVEFFYWRKHPNLEGFMANLYVEKGGASKSFNCDPVILSLEDLNVLETFICEDQLPETTGFFFGKSVRNEYAITNDFRFVELARKYIREGKVVYYISSW